MMRQGVMPKTKSNSFFPAWVRQRELRQQSPLGHSDVFYKSLYSSISPWHTWGGGETSKSDHGGLYSLEFSTDGAILVAGCEKNSFLMFDPLSRRLIHTIPNAHKDVVTHVKFLDSKIFATGSVDGAVSLWDTRNLKSRLRTLLGHAYTIGNIEFSRKNDLLITTALDGIICLWDMNNWDEREEFNKKMFWSHILLRLRVNPDETKMVISTGSGYLLIVHDLDLNTLAEDLEKFELQMFGHALLDRTTSTSCQNWSNFVSFNHRKNRMEIVAEFPNRGGFNVISALEFHPQGWSVFSRSACEASKQEWTYVHDIQERESCKGGSAPRGRSGEDHLPCPQEVDAGRAKRQRLERINEKRSSARGDGGSPGSLKRESAGFCMPSSIDFGPELPDVACSLEKRTRKRRSSSPADTARARSPSPAPSSVPPFLLELASLGRNPPSFGVQDPLLPRPNSYIAQFNRSVYERFPRMTHYIEEPYSSDWYIESMGVSADGRLVCSPFGCGIRLLAFSPECSEQSVSSYGTKRRRLHELSTHISHSDSVFCTKFSPRHCVLVSGCLDGKLAWYQPIV